MKKTVVFAAVMMAAMMLFTSCAQETKVYDEKWELTYAMDFEPFIPDGATPVEFKSIGKMSEVTAEYGGHTFILRQAVSDSEDISGVDASGLDSTENYDFKGTPVLVRYKDGEAGVGTWRSGNNAYSVYSAEDFTLYAFDCFMRGVAESDFLGEDDNFLNAELSVTAEIEESGTIEITGDEGSIGVYDYYAVREPADGVLAKLMIGRPENAQKAEMTGIMFEGTLSEDRTVFTLGTGVEISGEAELTDDSVFTYDMKCPEHEGEGEYVFAVGADMSSEEYLYTGELTVFIVRPSEE